MTTHTISYSKVYQTTLALELFQKCGWILWCQESPKATQFREKNIWTNTPGLSHTWHQTGRNGGYTSRLCCHSASPGQAGKLGREEPDEVQRPAPGEEQPHAPVQAWSGPAGEQLCGGGVGCAGGRQVDHEPAVCPGCQESQWNPGVH